jgi:hypothetical protein
VARAAFVREKLPQGIDPGLDEEGTYIPTQETFPNGCHICEVEIDPDTGTIEMIGYWVVDDVGTEVNPLTLKGQVIGGVVQGVGQILMEQIAYDADSGQLLTASFMDYAMPRASDLCNIAVGSHPVPTKLNPLGVKGAGEAGNGRRDAGRDERDSRCARTARGSQLRHAGDAGARLARDPGRARRTLISRLYSSLLHEARPELCIFGDESRELFGRF